MAVIGTDTFTGTAATALPTYSANWLLQTGGANLLISSSGTGARGSSNTMHSNYWNAAFAEQHYAKVQLFGATISAGAVGGAAVRIQTGSKSFIYAAYDKSAGVVYVGRSISGSATDFYAPGDTFADGDLIELRCEATAHNYTLYRNGSFVRTFDRSGDTAGNKLTGGYAGVSAFGAGDPTIAAIDSWEGGNVDALRGGLMMLGVG